VYGNGKMRPAETIPGMGGIKESSEGMDSRMVYVRYSKNLCKCHD
jgi:hypothetical protein